MDDDLDMDPFEEMTAGLHPVGAVEGALREQMGDERFEIWIAQRDAQSWGELALQQGFINRVNAVTKVYEMVPKAAKATPWVLAGLLLLWKWVR